MQLALNHPATAAGPDKLPFLFVNDHETTREILSEDAAFPVQEDRNDRSPAAIVMPPHAQVLEAEASSAPEAMAPAAEDENYAQLYLDECRRADLLEQRLTSAMVLLHETTAERDRWYTQAQRALSLIDGLRRQLDTTLQPPRRPVTRKRRRRLFGLF
jgi:hypothetical protein